MRGAALIAIITLAVSACGTSDWSFDADGGVSPARVTSTSGCSTDSDCMIASLHCDNRSGQCVECVGDMQCSDRRHCDPMLLRCVECRNDNQCPTNHRCQPIMHECVPNCASNADCPQSAPWCSQRGVCVGCNSNQDCAGMVNLLGTCDFAIGQCAECTGDLYCPSQRPICDRTTDACVGCLTGFDCLQNQVCDPHGHECVSPVDGGGYDRRDGADEFTPH